MSVKIEVIAAPGCEKCKGAQESLHAVAVGGGSPPREALLHVSVAMALAVSVGSLFAVQPLIDLARHAAGALPF